MVKNIFLIRHAEASHAPGLQDFDRPLTDRGLAEAEKMSRELSQYSLLPKFIISSPAKRALRTAMIFSETLHIPNQRVQPENMIYEATVSSLLSIVNHLPEKHDRVALFGHNPSITEFAEYLSDKVIGNIPTAGIIHIQFSTNSWKLVGAGTGEIKWKAGVGL